MKRINYNSCTAEVNEMWNGVRNVQRIPNVSTLNTQPLHILYLIYKMRVATISQLCFMTNYDSETIIQIFTNIKSTANKVSKVDDFLEKKQLHSLGRKKTYYKLNRYGHEYLMSFTLEEVEFVKERKNKEGQYIHMADMSYLYSRLFKYVYDMDIEREVGLNGYRDSIIKDADAIYNINYTKDISDKLILEHDTGSTNQASKSYSKIIPYADIFNMSKDNKLIVSVSRPTMMGPSEVNKLYKNERFKILKKVISIIGKISSSHPLLRQLKLERLLNNINEITPEDLNRKDDSITVKRLSYIDLVEKVSYLNLQREEWLYAIPEESTVSETNKYLKSFKFSVIETNMIDKCSYSYDLTYAKSIRQSILNSDDKDTISQDEFSKMYSEDIEKENKLFKYYKKIETESGIVYSHNSLKIGMLHNELMVAPMYPLGDIICYMTKAMTDPKEFFNAVFFPFKDLIDFKYEPVVFQKADIEYRKSIYSATGVVDGEKIGMFFLIPSLSVSDQYKMDTFNSSTGEIDTIDCDNIFYITLGINDFASGDSINHIYDRDYYTDIVHSDGYRKYEGELEDLYNEEDDDNMFWVTDDLRKKITSILS